MPERQESESRKLLGCLRAVLTEAEAVVAQARHNTPLLERSA
jgi:hypothetical protein